jgi:hypothetical protein
MLTLIYNNDTFFARKWVQATITDDAVFMGSLDDTKFTLVKWDIDLPDVPSGYDLDNYVADPDTQTVTLTTIANPKPVLEAKLADDSITFTEMKELMRLRG